MPAIKLDELKNTNAGLHKGGMGSECHTSGVSVRYCTSTNETYTNALNSILPTITKIGDT